MSETTKHSEQQAACQLESIREMVAALGVDWDRLADLREERGHRRAIWEKDCPEEVKELADLEKSAGECENEDDARQRIAEDPLSVEVRSGWYTPGDGAAEPEEYCILLCTGGPACRLIGKLSDGEPNTARLEHQDWGTPWTEYIPARAHEDALLTYAREFYFGE